MAHEIIERNQGLDEIVLVGLQTGGVPLADALADGARGDRGRRRPGVGTLDVAFYRDDIGLRPVLPEAVTDIPVDLTGKVVVLVDDVLFTGRTIRAALDALTDYGRPRSVQLAVMVDRGHRELPIRPDYVGKNLPTRRDEVVDVSDRRRRPGRDARDEHDSTVELHAHCERNLRLGRPTASRRCCGSPTPSSRSASGPSPRCRPCGARPSSGSSTRTPPAPGCRFETAAKRLSADTMNFSVVVLVGEEGRVAARHRRDHRGDGRRRASWSATARPGVPWQIARWVDAAVINAGDGWHEHPTQALLDCYTIRQHLGGLEGRASPSSATSSTAGWPAPTSLAFTGLGRRGHPGGPADAAAAQPRGLAGEGQPRPRRGAAEGRRGLPAAHAARAHDRGVVPSLREYTARYGLTRRRVDRLADDALVMHPGPMNRGVEIAAEVADRPRSVIIDQVPQRRRRPHGGAVPARSGPGPDQEVARCADARTSPPDPVGSRSTSS